ncbi:hypothetical protein [Streptomyces sp. NRRL S-646]|uniref:hypothetical protein n=1 Tax=Streptomyces sp. NRRL S-646 TaxID=1463917 RepID=UPI0013316A0B|nr:hypothetical protein [Streptomyces sp. NRRL S-646]
MQWHYGRCVLAPGAEESARNEVGVQVFRVGRSLGVQFHPEITMWMLRGWLANGGAEQALRHGVDPGQLLARGGDLEAIARLNARNLVDGFLDRVADATD